MPPEETAAIVRLAEAVSASIADSRDERREIVKTMHSIAIDVAKLAANSEAERGHRMALERRLEHHEESTVTSINALKDAINETARDQAARQVKVGVLWSGATAAVAACIAFVWHTITGKGG